MVNNSLLEEPAIIEVASADPSIPNRKLAGTIQTRANKSLTLITSQEIAAAVAVWVQTKDLLTLGQVLHCFREPDATWTVHVRVDRTLLVI